jgi:hypothetical protein
MDSQDNSNQLVSIERVVAFLLGPIVVAGSGTLSAYLATKVGIEVSASTITGAFATGGLAAGALAWKWLHGRQIQPLLNTAGKYLGEAQTGIATLGGVSVAKQDDVLHTTFAELEALAEKTAKKVAAEITGPKAGETEGKTSAADTTLWIAPPAQTSEPPPPTPIPVAANDPAPAGAAPVAFAAPGPVADVGAAPTQ